MGEGFLAVATHPSSHLGLEEFHEWYEEEHIPIRLNCFKEFLSGARYKVVSHQGHSSSSGHQSTERYTQPSWLALYTVDSPAFFASTAYRDLRITRSDREKDVMSRLQVLTRRTGEIIGTYLRGGEEKSTGFKPGQPSGWVVTHGINLRGVDQSVGDITSWASHIEQQVVKYSDIEDGWARSLLVLVLESGITHFAVNVEADDEVRMPYFGVHEFINRESAESFIKLMLASADGGIEFGERTLWELYKAYPCLANEG